MDWPITLRFASGNRPFFQTPLNPSSQIVSPVTLVISHYLYNVQMCDKLYAALFQHKMKSLYLTFVFLFSVTMTSCSTLASLGFMPLNLFIYTRSWTGHGVTIPYTNILITLVSILVPVAFGMLLRWKKPEWAKKILMVCFFLLYYLIS